MKAVQRKVFPGGVAVAPEIDSTPSTSSLPGTPASAPIADLTARVDALESQLGSFTGQLERTGFRLKKVEDTNRALEDRLKALETAAAAAKQAASEPETPPVATPLVKPATSTTPKPAAAKPATALTKPVTPATATAKPVASDPKRAAAIKAAVEIPVTEDPIEDTYAYGYRLWAAKFYPEAVAQLKDFVAKNAKHRRVSAAQLFIGRAYLDDGKPGLASVAFYENYQRNPKGERAPDSLYWLGVALTKLKKLPDACKVYQEFDEVYGASANSGLKERVATARVDAECAQ